jgi:hypothetical protein
MLLMSVQPPISTIPCITLYPLANPVLFFDMFAPRATSLPRPTRGHFTNRSCALSLNAFNSGAPLPFNIATFEPSNLQATNLDAASSISPLIATLTENTRGGGYIFQSKFFSFRSLTTRHSLLSTISFKIRTSAKHTRNPSRIRTSKTQDLKPFRIRTYRKTGGEGGLIVSQILQGGRLNPKTIEHAKMNPYRGGDTVSTEAVAARRHAGTHLPVTWWKLEMPTTTWHLLLN